MRVPRNRQTRNREKRKKKKLFLCDERALPRSHLHSVIASFEQKGSRALDLEPGATPGVTSPDSRLHKAIKQQKNLSPNLSFDF
ncbi:hypothetical protein VIGAN_09086700 [Vigna angularis var. angularis]|uniref:Uncharacterized protein n=1 Tax=Vigna angularis var. angularis TaxID=157739 RepID=A0A0S3SX87_PHAAN|nr:hypothetical protein VIGAN_09086700 [Vigna angularis var. angularis]